MAGCTREIVTLQLGHYANFVGTHWWNIQESSFVYSSDESSTGREVNPDVLFREGQNLTGDVTYTPRLILFDLKGSLNTLKQDGELYDVPDVPDDLKWPNDVTLHKTEVGPKNAFLRDLESEEQEARDCPESDRHAQWMDSEADSCSIEADRPDPDHIPKVEQTSAESAVFGTKLYNLDDEVKVWSDYLRVHLHPKSVQIVEQYRHNSEMDQFSLYGQGQSVCRDYQTHSDLEDRLHFFLEDCDNLQGLHILCDPYDGFGGLSSSILEELRDEYPGKGILVCPLHPVTFTSNTPQQTRLRLLNSMMCYSSLAEHSSALLPLSLAATLGGKGAAPRSLPYLQYKAGLAYHTGAVLASCLDSLSLPYRQDSQPSLLSHLTDALTPAGRKVLSLQASLPFPVQPDESLADTLLRLGDQLPWQPLTPGCHANQKTDGQSVVLQGFDRTRLKRSGQAEYPRALSQCSSVDEMFHMYLIEKCGTARNALCSLERPAKVQAPYPHVFSSEVNRNGELTSTTRPQNTGVESVPLLTSLQCSPGVSPLLSTLVSQCSKRDLRHLHSTTEAGLEPDTMTDALDALQELVQAYSQAGADMH